MLHHTITEKNDEQIAVTFSGRIDNESTQYFQDVLDGILKRYYPTVLFDFSDLLFINSSGIGKLLLFYKKLNNKDSTLVIDGIDDDILTLFKAIRIDKLIEIREQ